MALTVKEALKRLNISSNRVLGGKKGLDRLITRVNILEVPDIIQWLDGGELLLTTGFALKDNPELQLSLVAQLAQKGVAALAIKEGRYLTPIPSAMIEYADDLSLPLIELPADVPLSRIMAPIYEILLNQQLNQIKHAEKIHRLFLDIILKNQGIEEIGKTLVNLIDKNVLIIDTRFQLLFNSFREKEISWLDFLEALKGKLTKSFSNKHNLFKPLRFQYKDFNLLIYPAISNNKPLGYILILHDGTRPVVHENMACEQAALVTALELTKLNAIYNAECKSKEEIVEELLYGSIINVSSLKRKASSLNFLLEGKLLIFIVRWDKPSSITESNFVKEVEEIFKGYKGGILCYLRFNQIIGLIGLHDTPEEKIESLLNKVAAQISSEVNGKVVIGVGRAYEDLTDIAKSYQEAKIAVRVGASLKTKMNPIFFKELGSLVCLNEIKGTSVARKFYQETIGKLKEYDQENDSQLIYTLETYFNNLCVLRQTAKALYMHRNSLDYRLKKIVKLTGKDFFNNPLDKFDLELAVRLSYFLD